MNSILVKDYMDHNAHTVLVTTSVQGAVEAMLRDKVSGTPVVDAEHRLVGYVSEQDCIQEMLNDAFFCEEPAPVTKVMNTEVVSIDADTTVVEVAQRFIKERYRIYPVVSNGKLVGVINRAHVLKALMESNQDCYLRK